MGDPVSSKAMTISGGTPSAGNVAHNERFRNAASSVFPRSAEHSVMLWQFFRVADRLSLDVVVECLWHNAGIYIIPVNCRA